MFVGRDEQSGGVYDVIRGERGPGPKMERKCSSELIPTLPQPSIFYCEPLFIVLSRSRNLSESDGLI